jgi:hypothetical protein
MSSLIKTIDRAQIIFRHHALERDFNVAVRICVFDSNESKTQGLTVRNY